jgi:TolB-like protein
MGEPAVLVMQILSLLAGPLMGGLASEGESSSAQKVQKAKPMRFMVLPFRGEVFAPLLGMFADEAREGARESLPDKKFVVVSRPETEAAVHSIHHHPCQDEACELAALKHANARAGITGTVARQDGGYLLTVSLVDAKTGKTLATEKVEAEDEDGLLSDVRDAAENLCDKLSDGDDDEDGTLPSAAMGRYGPWGIVAVLGVGGIVLVSIAAMIVPSVIVLILFREVV